MLNKQQLELVQAPKGKLLCIAGAGSGKTKCIIDKIQYAIKKQGIKPDEILAITFTKKAATEMHERVSKIVGKKASKALTLGTINSFCYRYVVLDNLKYFGFCTNQRPQILTEGYKPILKALFPKESSQKFLTIAAKKLDYFLTRAIPVPDDDYVSLNNKDWTYKDLLALIRRFQFDNQLITFTDQIVFAYQRLERDVEFRKSISSKYKLIIVDEAQDNNYMQNKIVLFLSEVHNNIVCVGDDAQSIYYFRGADPNFFLDLNKNHGFKVHSLTTNYRSVQPILDLGNYVLEPNFKADVQIHKKLVANRDSSEAQKPKFCAFSNYLDEMDSIVDIIKKYVGFGGSYKDISVLCRSVLGGLGRPLQATFRSYGIPYHVVGGHDITNNQHVRKMFSAFALACGYTYHEDWAELLTIFPGIGAVKGRKLAENIDNAKIPDSIKDGFESLKQIVKQISFNKKNPTTCYEDFADWYKNIILKYYPDTCDEDMEHISHILSIVGNSLCGKDLELAIETIKMDEKREDEKLEDKDAVVISTIHRSKGLEWPFVIIPDCHSGMIPHPNCSTPREVQEECRVFHVGITRAKDFLMLTATLNDEQKISSFLKDALHNGLVSS